MPSIHTGLLMFGQKTTLYSINTFLFFGKYEYIRSDMSLGVIIMTYSRNLIQATNEVILLHSSSSWGQQQYQPIAGIEPRISGSLDPERLPEPLK